MQNAYVIDRNDPIKRYILGMSTIWGQHYLYKYQIPQIVDPQIFVQIVVINFHTKFQKNVEKISKLGSKNDKMEYF